MCGSLSKRTRGVVEEFLDVDFSRNEVLLQRVINDRLQRRTAGIETERQKVDRASRRPTGSLLADARAGDRPR